MTEDATEETSGKTKREKVGILYSKRIGTAAALGSITLSSNSNKEKMKWELWRKKHLACPNSSAQSCADQVKVSSLWTIERLLLTSLSFLDTSQDAGCAPLKITGFQTWKSSMKTTNKLVSLLQDTSITAWWQLPTTATKELKETKQTSSSQSQTKIACSALTLSIAVIHASTNYVAALDLNLTASHHVGSERSGTTGEKTTTAFATWKLQSSLNLDCGRSTITVLFTTFQEASTGLSSQKVMQMLKLSTCMQSISLTTQLPPTIEYFPIYPYGLLMLKWS